MSYKDELEAKLNAVRVVVKEDVKKYNISSADQIILDELKEEFDLSKYDLHEDDVLRAIKIESILDEYYEVFEKKYSLKIFYSIAKSNTINVNSLYKLFHLNKNNFLKIIKIMKTNGLLLFNEFNEVYLSKNGRSLAKSIGIDMFI